MTAIAEAVLDRERAFAAAFAKAALRGIRLDPDRVHRLIAEHRDSREAARERVEAATAGVIDNPKSSVKVAGYLAERGYPLPASGKTGRPGAGKGVLAPLAHLGDELCTQILQYRADDTALGLLLEPRAELIANGDGRVRTSILTLAANTGRTSSRNENLQQVSRQGGMRACHVADPGTLIVSADFSSVEVRVGAALSGDRQMQWLIAMGDAHPEQKREFDFHWRTAVTCYGPDATKEHRYTSKRLNFGKMYGSGKRSASETVGVPLPEVSRAFDAFDAVAPQYKAWDEYMRNEVRNGTKSWELYSGRQVYFGNKGEHAAGNAVIQATAREFLVDAVEKWRKGRWKDALIVPIHDEVVAFDIPEAEAEAATAFLVECMTRDFMGVRIAAEANAPSQYWMDAS